MNPRFCICGKLAPVAPAGHVDGDWMRVDLDGKDGPIDPIWICPAHRDEPDAELSARVHCALMRAAADQRLAVAS